MPAGKSRLTLGWWESCQCLTDTTPLSPPNPIISHLSTHSREIKTYSCKTTFRNACRHRSHNCPKARWPQCLWMNELCLKAVTPSERTQCGKVPCCVSRFTWHPGKGQIIKTDTGQWVPGLGQGEEFGPIGAAWGVCVGWWIPCNLIVLAVTQNSACVKTHRTLRQIKSHFAIWKFKY